MDKRRSSPAAEPTRERDVNPVAGTLQRLVEEVAVLRQALDEVRVEVQWAARNLLNRGASPVLPPIPPVV